MGGAGRVRAFFGTVALVVVGAMAVACSVTPSTSREEELSRVGSEPPLASPAAPPPLPGGRPRPLCELVTVEEVGAVLGSPAASVGPDPQGWAAVAARRR
ncbi:hypothetical protein Psuf_066730 [Phytohabitans suffuscus]|uniref:Lipoprotein n=1 Tax=Phytohabitans suffuscus TaxID=624315 RepID=A0A6F8YT81_9ACTN|nr:hypothetical protein Psuf_066730 [Phytohabitans suffuscus]